MAAVMSNHKTSDIITILKTMRGKRMTKMWRADGIIDGYEDALNFKVRQVNVSSIDGLHRLLTSIEHDADTCLIRGRFVGESQAQSILPPEYPGHYLRRNVLFEDQRLHVCCLDVDGFKPLVADPVTEPVEAITEFIDTHLPEAFHGTSYHWQLSSSAGAPKNRGILKAHIWFWLETPYNCAELKAWAKYIGAAIDSSLFSQVQAHYTALPVFEHGVTDPVPVRSGIVEGWMTDSVDLRLDASVLSKVRAFDNDSDDIELIDPTTKPGVIGAFCRAFTIEQVLERWLSDHFEFQGDSTRRLTYKKGGGMPGGAYVRDDREYVVSKHSTDPCDNRATHKFDLVRVHLYGHLDEGQEALTLASMGGRPSYLAMVDMVSALPEVASQSHGAKVEARAGWEQRIAAAADEHALQTLIEREIAFDLNLSTVDAAVLEQVIKSRFTEIGLTLPIAAIRKMLKKRGRRPLPDLTAEGRPLETFGNIAAICDNESVVIRYNVIKKEDEILAPGMQWSLDNRREASISNLRSLLHQHEVPTKYMKGFVTQMADANQFNPAAIWVTSKPWDGVSRVQDFYDTVVEDSEVCTKAAKEMMMLRWAISAIAAIMNPNGVMARGVLVFQGQQYAGKTRWIESLAPKDLELVKTGRTLNVHDKDSVKQILSCWIAELGELDSTFKRSDLAGLKAFITKDFDELRRPFAQAESQFARRTVFAASVNEKKFLQDETGNTRFWTIAIDSINHGHTLDMQQVWAEFLELWKQGALHYLTTDEMRILNTSNEAFENQSPIVELVTTGLDWANFDPKICKWMSASDVLRWLNHKTPSKWDATSAGVQIQKLNGGLSRKSNGVRLSAVPLGRILLDSHFDDKSLPEGEK